MVRFSARALHAADDPPALAGFLTKHGVTRQLYTPSLLEAVLDWGGESAERTAVLAAAFASFRVLVLCGEVVTVELRRRFLEVAPPGVQLLNLYSVSECHDVSMADLNAPGFKTPTSKYCPTGQLLPGCEVIIIAEGSGEDGPEHFRARDEDLEPSTSEYPRFLAPNASPQNASPQKRATKRGKQRAPENQSFIGNIHGCTIPL